MKIMVFGAGVLGSLYSARLKLAGNEVSILARGKRLTQILKNGIVLEQALTGEQVKIPMPVVECLGTEDRYDLIVVLVKKNQIPSVLPVLAANRGTPNILIMVNNASGYDEWSQAVGRERLVLGFAGAGGFRHGHVVLYTVVSRLLQPTTFGEPAGSRSPRLRSIMKVFHDAGFPTAFTSDMDAWQKTHVAWVGPVANAIYMAGGDNINLARSPEIPILLVRAVREGFEVLRRLGIPITPGKLRVWSIMPEAILVRAIRFWASTDHFRTVIVEHTLAAPDEMRQLAKDFSRLAEAASLITPSINTLRSFIPEPAGE